VLLVAAQLGKFQLAVLPLQIAGSPPPSAKPKGGPARTLGLSPASLQTEAPIGAVEPHEIYSVQPVWAAEVSPALDGLPRVLTPLVLQACNPNASITGSTLECQVRRPKDVASKSASPLFPKTPAPVKGERQYYAEEARHE
jgi:hypothetical protein